MRLTQAGQPLPKQRCVTLCCSRVLTVHAGHTLLTSHHLLTALLQPAGANNNSSSPVVHQLLQELGFDVQQVSAAAGGSGSEDDVPCEPLGFLHEEFYSSLCAELLPGAVHGGSPCLN